MITSTSNPTVKFIRELQARRRAREEARSFVIEGVRLVEEAVRAGIVAKIVLHTHDLDARGQAALESLRHPDAEVHAVAPRVMAAAAGTQTPPGLLAVLPLPSAVYRPPSALSFVLVLDRLSDPGNLGTVLRTADAAGIEAVFLAPGTVDACNPKVVRAAMGAHFHLPILEAGWDELRERLAGLTVWLAEAREGERYDLISWRAPCALLIGSEAEGPSAEALEFTPHRVHIPMPGRAESLNAAVAAGVLLFEAARQRA